MITCAPPDQAVGVALRLSGYLDCQARALGENGFQALAGGPVMAGLLSGLITIFIALIGYRLILGQTPAIGEGVVWAVRLGLVLALATSWPAFQAVIYRVAVEGPGELAGVLLPAAGLPSEDLNTRLQQAYDTLRLGPGSEQLVTAPPAAADLGLGQAATPATAPGVLRGPGQPPLPQTASLLVISTLGVGEAFRVAIGFLLAVGPLAIMGLLFDATFGLFTGWLRVLAGSALGLLAVTVVTAIELMVVEGEIAHLQRYSAGFQSEVFDPQALTTVVLLFCVVTLLATLAAVRMVGAFRTPQLARVPLNRLVRASPASPSPLAISTAARAASQKAVLSDRPPRAAAVADALTQTLHREQTHVGERSASPARRSSIVQAASRSDQVQTILPLGVAGRRSLPRRTGSSSRRDLR